MINSPSETLIVTAAIGVAVLVFGEIIARVEIFKAVSKRFELDEQAKDRASSMGTIERTMLFLGLAAQIPMVLPVYAAFKISSWFIPLASGEKPTAMNRDFYVANSLLNVMLALVYFVLWGGLLALLMTIKLKY